MYVHIFDATRVFCRTSRSTGSILYIQNRKYVFSRVSLYVAIVNFFACALARFANAIAAVNLVDGKIYLGYLQDTFDLPVYLRLVNAY